MVECTDCADAELGRLVRRMPDGWALVYHAALVNVDGKPWTVYNGQEAPIVYGRTPEAALRAALEGEDG